MTSWALRLPRCPTAFRSQYFDAVKLRISFPRTIPLQGLPSIVGNPSRTFSVCPSRLKKSKQFSSDIPDAKSDASRANIDPNDFSTLEADIESAHGRLKTQLSQLRPGGRTDITSALESLKVTLSPSTSQSTSRKGKKGSSSSGSEPSVPLSDLAQIVTRGREVHLLLSDDAAGSKSAHAKAIDSAIQKSSLGLVASQANANVTASSSHTAISSTSDDMALEGSKLVYTLPIQTTESRRKQVVVAEEHGREAADMVRNARATRQKQAREWGLKKLVLPDALRKSIERMEKIVTKAQDDVKKAVEGAKRVLSV